MNGVTRPSTANIGDAFRSAMGSASVSPFGDAIVSSLNVAIGIKPTYGILDDTETFEATGGTVTASNGQYVLQSGTSAGGYATLWSKRPVIYRPGIGCEARITAMFTTGIASSTQLCGMFTAADGMLFGYDGASFGVMHRYGGEFEVRKYTVTAAATGATITVTLNGVGYDVAIAASATVQEAAHDIEVALNADSTFMASWRVQHIDDSLVFVFRGTGPKSGSYSITGDATLAGTFSQINAGVAPAEDWTHQSSWNKDKAQWLDVTKGNLYRVEFAYLGHGPLNYYIMNPDTMEWVLVHQVKWPNNQTSPNFGNPSMRIGWASASLGSSGTNLTVKGSSAMGALQGERFGGENRKFGIEGTNTAITTETQILSIQVREEFGGRFCNAVAEPIFNLATDSGKGMIFRIYKNPTVAGNTNHQYVDETNSISLYDTAGTTVTGGTIIATVVLGPSGSEIVKDLSSFLTAGDELVVTGEVTTGAASGGYVSATILETL